MSILDKPWGFVLGLSIGSAIGTVSGFFIFKKVIKPEVQENSIDMDRMQEFYNEKILELTRENKKLKLEKEGITEEEFMKRVNQNAMQYSKNLEKERLEKARNEVPAEALDENGEPKKVLDNHPNIKENEYKSYNKEYRMKCETGTVNIREDVKTIDAYPHKITFDEWRKDANYKKVSLMYYELDNIFATLGDERTDYTDDYFGIHNICEFGAITNSGMGHDSWTLYLRDDLTKTDFEIFYDGTKYFDDVVNSTGGEK